VGVIASTAFFIARRLKKIQLSRKGAELAEFDDPLAGRKRIKSSSSFRVTRMLTTVYGDRYQLLKRIGCAELLKWLLGSDVPTSYNELIETFRSITGPCKIL